LISPLTNVVELSSAIAFESSINSHDFDLS
jgi:hypothetical protein